MSTTASPRLPLDIRLHVLESQVLGPNYSAGPSKSQQPITRRVQDIHERLERASAQSDGLKRLLAGYDRYLPLLDLSDTHVPSSAQDLTSTTEADLLPDAVKVTMLLEAASDIRTAERDLREIELLKARGVDGSGELEDLLPLRGDLMAATKRAQKRGREVDKARREVGDLLMRYNDFTETVSDLFMDLHHRMTAIEQGVARLERKKRKELAERY